MGRFFIGVDVGGTKVRGALFKEGSPTILEEFLFRTPKTKKEFITQLTNELVQLKKQQQISGVGFALPGAVDMKRVLFVKAPNIPFLDGWDIARDLKEIKLPARCDHDARCFLRAEVEYGACKHKKNVLGVSIGTGIGGALLIDGKLYLGAHGTAGEFGHMIIDGRKSFEALGAKEAFVRYGDRSEFIGIGIANMINSFDPEVVVLGGGGGISEQVHMKTVEKMIERYVMSPSSRKIPVVRARLGESAQVIGAALLFER